jgi:UbiD family decarboxylase
LHKIKVKVDPDWEIGAICRENFDRGGPALQFEKIGKSNTPLVVGVLGTSRRYGMALDCPRGLGTVYPKWQSAFDNPIEPVIVEGGPCKEVKIGKINLYEDPFPVPRWHILDGGPYLGTFHMVICKDPETGWINGGMYRNQILEEDKLGLHANPNQHIKKILEKWGRLQEPMPVAIAIGLNPYLSLVALSRVPEGVDEYSIAGSLGGFPIEVTRAETSELLVPAWAEIILEGLVPVEDFYPHEGPLGETPGYMGEVCKNSHYINILSITHRRNPIFQGTYEGRPPNESALTMQYARSIVLYRYLLESGIRGLRDVCVTLASRGMHAVVSIEKGYVDHPRDIIKQVLNCPEVSIKHCVVVDEDINPWDSFEVEWAVATRVQADRDVEIIEGGKTYSFDVSQPPSKRGSSAWLGIDATTPIEEYEKEGASFPQSSEPAEETLKKVRARWQEYGFSNKLL